MKIDVHLYYTNNKITVVECISQFNSILIMFNSAQKERILGLKIMKTGFLNLNTRFAIVLYAIRKNQSGKSRGSSYSTFLFFFPLKKAKEYWSQLVWKWYLYAWYRLPGIYQFHINILESGGKQNCWLKRQIDISYKVKLRRIQGISEAFHSKTNQIML